MSLFFQPVTETVVKRRSPVEAIELCLRDTFAVLSAAGLATETDMARTFRVVERAAAGESGPADILETLVKVQGTVAEFMLPEVTRLTGAMSKAMYPVMQIIPFAGKLIAPTALYEAYPEVKNMAKLLMAPVIYAEDTDSIGIGALNPVAAKIMAEEVLAAVDERLGVKPFMTAVRMDYESWTYLTRKQFSL